MDAYQVFCTQLDRVIRPLLNKNIIIYGYNRGGDFVRWYFDFYYSKKIKAFVDRWAFSPSNTIPHLWCFYYIHEPEDVIVNVTPYRIPDEFNDTGERWDRTGYTDEQIVNLWDEIYDRETISEHSYPEITFYEWLEVSYKLDVTKTIRRQFVAGEGHGYFPTDFRMIYEGVTRYGFDPEKDAVLDIGSGKGSAVFSLCAAGFKKIGAVEYTDNIYDVLIENLEKLELAFEERDTGFSPENELQGSRVFCYQGDAAEMTDALDGYNWFFMFNPFPEAVLRRVIGNICESIKRKPRVCHIFYAEPIGHSFILETGMFVRNGCVKSDYSDTSYYAYIYESREGLADEN